MKIDFITRRTGNYNLDTYLYLIKNAHKFDILQVYHPTIYNVLFLLFFKLLNFYKKTRTYLKLDANESIFSVNNYSIRKQKIYYFLIKYVDVISVETTSLFDKLIKMKAYKNNLIYLPNGYYPKVNYDFNIKQNTMIYVGKVGDDWKQNEILMKAFVKFYQLNQNWKLKFLGAIFDDFKPTINNYFIDNPQLVNIVSFTGNISDKKQLLNEYQKAKILILTSKQEGFPLVFTEAMNSGCHIITSSVLAANDVTNQGTTGEVFPVGDVDALVRAMVKMDKKLKTLSGSEIEEYDKVRDFFYWKDILQSLNDKLQLS